MVNVAIIGSAGRGFDAYKLNRDIFLTAVYKTCELVEFTWNLDWNDVTLVSGGSAFGDHIAVKIYMNLKKEYPKLKLRLHLPCDWDTSLKKFQEAGADMQYAKQLNHLHQVFSLKCNVQSLKDLQTCIAEGCEITTSSGYFARNDKVAQEAEKMIAFTFGDMQEGRGGTSYTYSRAFNAEKVHIDLDKVL
jgi:hypothetical protein